jgi:hypothetical protein
VAFDLGIHWPLLFNLRTTTLPAIPEIDIMFGIGYWELLILAILGLPLAAVVLAVLVITLGKRRSQ